MRVFAPGKMLITGAYAVLEGAPALVASVSRGAVAFDGETGPSTPEVLAALGEAPAPRVDAGALFEQGRKLGLGASGAILVATLGLVRRRRGQDLASPSVREEIFAEARRAHAEAQQGGSGVDVAASVHGGVLRYTLRGGSGGSADIAPARLPSGVSFTVYSSRTSARTPVLRAAVDALRQREPRLHTRLFSTLTRASVEAVRGAESDDPESFLAAVQAFGRALFELGRAADAPIVPGELRPLAAEAERSGAAFLPSGAGGGDVALLLGTPPHDFDARARSVGWAPLPLTVDTEGVRMLSASPG